MQLTDHQKAKTSFVLRSLLVAIFIVFVPKIVTGDAKFAREETLEVILLVLGLATLGLSFHFYGKKTSESEEKALVLDTKLRKKERELLGALEYLGKVNVQISMINSIFDHMKAPATKAQLNDIYEELLRIVSSVTGGGCVFLRILNLKNGKTITEWKNLCQNGDKLCNLNAGNNKLIGCYKDGKNPEFSNCNVFYSLSDNFSIKAFIFVSKRKKQDFSKDEKIFLETIANQCEIVYLLFNSRFYNTNGKNEGELKNNNNKK